MFAEENEFLTGSESQLIEADVREGFGHLSDAEMDELNAWYDRQDELSAIIIEEAERNAQWIEAWTEAEYALDLV